VVVARMCVCVCVSHAFVHVNLIEICTSKIMRGFIIKLL
jgi:hypothetical protein